MNLRVACRWPWAVGLAAVLSGCGGSLAIGIGDGWDDPPTVALTASATEGAPGDVVRLAAAAADDYGVDAVAFYLVESDGRLTRLGSDGTAPFQWDVTLPDTPGISVRYLARAFDGAGQASDGATVSIAVR